MCPNLSFLVDYVKYTYNVLTLSFLAASELQHATCSLVQVAPLPPSTLMALLATRFVCFAGQQTLDLRVVNEITC